LVIDQSVATLTLGIALIQDFSGALTDLLFPLPKTTLAKFTPFLCSNLVKRADFPFRMFFHFHPKIPFLNPFAEINPKQQCHSN
jgi:hypothetical protein